MSEFDSALGHKTAETRKTGGTESFAPLTKQQARAMLAFLWDHGREGFDDEACDLTVWDWGVQPWPTMGNLERKGLVEAVSWYGRDEGWRYRLTDLGRAYMRSVVAARRAERSWR